MGGVVARWRIITAVLALLAGRSPSDASSCSFEDGTLCGWMIQGGWIASEAGTVSSSAVDETYMNSTGYVLSFNNQSLRREASFVSPLAYYPSSSCSLTFYYHPPVDVAASLSLSLVSGMGDRWTAWNSSWHSAGDLAACNLTWQWYPVYISIPQFAYPFQVIFDASSDISNTTTRIATGCRAVALDEVKVTGCDPVAPQISTESSAIQVEEGNSFNLSVKVTGTPFPFVSWLRKDVPLLTNDRVTLTLSGTVVLIKNAMLSDTGIFTANASAVGRWSSVSLEVTVYVRPFIHEEPGNQTITQGSNLTLVCPASGHPNLTFVWYYQDKSSWMYNQTGEQLDLSNIESSQQGNYSCWASNKFGHVTWWTYVYVQVSPSIVNTSFGAQVIVPELGVIVLSCVASGQPTPTIAWDITLSHSPTVRLAYGQTHGGYTVLPNGGVEVRGIAMVNGSTVKCIAHNPAGDDRSESTAVFVKVNGMWSSWSPWSDCAVTCGSHQQTRSRSCSNPLPQNGGGYCTGNDTETQMCHADSPCPIDGGWSTWSEWMLCSTTCGLPGVRSRERTCIYPRPQNGGKNCQGPNNETESCHPPACQSVWGEWFQWTECSKICGIGHRFRERGCFNPVNKVADSNCNNNSSIDLDEEDCFKKSCPSFKNFTAEPQDQIVDVGSNARFDCRYEPKELVATWFKETENVKYAFKPGRLVIDSVSLVILEVETTDVGRYTCRVANNERAAKLSVSTASSDGLTGPTIGIIVAIGVVAILLVVFLVIIFLWITRSGSGLFKADHPPIEVQGAQLMRSQSLSSSTDTTLVATPTVQENIYAPEPTEQDDVAYQEMPGAERPATPNSPPTDRSSSVPALDSRRVDFRPNGKQRPRTLSIDGIYSPLKVQAVSSPGPRSAPGTPMDHRSGFEDTRKKVSFSSKVPGIPRTLGTPRTPSSPRSLPRRQSNDLLDCESGGTTPNSTLPRSKPRPKSGSTPVGSRRAMSNPHVAHSLSDHSSDHTPTTEGIPLRDMGRHRVPAPYESPAASDFYVGQTNFPERYRPSGSSTPGNHPPPLTNREPPKRSVSYDPRYIMESRSSPSGRHRPSLDIDSSLERTQSPHSQESDDVFDGAQSPADMKQRTKPKGPVRFYSIPTDHDGFRNPAYERRRSETNL